MPLEVAVPRLLFMPYLIRRSGRVYLMILSEINATVSNSIGNINGYLDAAMDLFEVPGRLLMR
jgi:hypothetical protein